MSRTGKPCIAFTPLTIARRRRLTKCLKFQEISTSCRVNVAAAKGYGGQEGGRSKDEDCND